VIAVGNGNNIVVGGFGNDTITTGLGVDIVLGDNGQVTYTPGTTLLLQAVSTDTVNATGGNDTIIAGAGDNLILAGVGADTVTAGSGVDLVMGDNGQIDWTASGVYSLFQTTDLTLGGADDIRVGDGDNIVAGGFGTDVIETGIGADLILGDNGLFRYTEVGGVAILTEARTTDTIPATGGSDIIVGGGGTADNIVLAGVGDDRVNQAPRVGTLVADPAAAVSAGQDIVIGDNGYVTWDGAGLITEFASIQLPYDPLVTDPGGNDLIAVGDGNNIVVGGFGNDTITTGVDNDIVLGDNGLVTYTPGTTLLLQAVSTDLVNETGGNDTIIAGEGDNLILAGVGADTVTTGAGTDLVMGDNGRFNWDSTGLLTDFASTDPALGGDDVIAVGNGNNIVVGGFGNDTITTGAGVDIVLGDNGQVTYTPGTTLLLQVVSTDMVNATGGNDTIIAGEGNNLILAGVGADTVTTGAGTDLVMGDNGQIDWTASGVYSQFQTTDPLLGGNDVILAGDGNNVVLGGFGTDTITTGTGTDVILGDNGVLQYTEVAGVAVLTAAQTTDVTPATGGSDVIVGGGGTVGDVILAGVGADVVTTVAASTSTLLTGAIVAGDTWVLDLVAGGVTTSFSYNVLVTDTRADLVAGLTAAINAVMTDDYVAIVDGGMLVVINQTGVSFTATYAAGPVAGPTVPVASATSVGTTSSGNDVVVGDNGYAIWDTTGLMITFGSIQLPYDPLVVDLGGNDVIFVGDGSNVVVGGFGSDTIVTGAGTDVILGDNGVATYTSGTTQLLQVASTDVTNATGGNDTIIAGEGNNVIVAGVGADTVTAGAGNDIVLGDNGQIDWTPTGEYSAFQTTDPALGANDVILAGDGNNIVAGGFGADQITTGLGQDLILGDNGIFTFTLNAGGTAVLTEARTTDVVNATGGDDVIVGGGGTAGDVILAGVGADTVTTVASTSTLLTGAIVAGDTWTLDLVAAGITTTFTYVPAPGATLADVMVGLAAAINAVTAGDYVAILDGGMLVVINQAGVSFAATYAVVPLAGPTVPVASATSVGTTSSGGDIVIGDNGYVNWDTGALITQFGSSDPQLGANDLIVVGDGNNIVVGGFGSDAIITGAGADIVLGDDGQVDYVVTDANSADIDLIQSTSTTAFGGADTIITGAGNDIVIGGRAGDTIDAGTGNNVVIGDSGQITSDVVDAPQLAGLPITLGLIETIQINDGGNDLVTTGTGNDIVLAGFGADTVTSGTGNDIVFGDNGQIVYTAAVMTTLQSTDTVALTGGNDIINAGDGNNIVIAGVGSDSVITGTGADIVIGDNGTINNYSNGALALIVSGDPLLGGNDTIVTGDGLDIAIGGAANDFVTSAGGNDILFGDGGQLTFTIDGAIVNLMSVDTLFGGNDTLDGGANNDILIGGAGNDLLAGNLSEDVLFGSYGWVTLVNGMVTRMDGDMSDLLTAAMMGQFTWLPHMGEEAITGMYEGLPGYMTVHLDGFGAFFGDFLIDDTIFEKTFRFSMDSLPMDELDAAMFQEMFSFEAVTQPDVPTHDVILELGDKERPAGQVDDEQDPAGTSLEPISFEVTSPDDPDHSGGDLIVAALGIAGLQAVQQPRSRGRRPLGREAMTGVARRPLSRTCKTPDSMASV
jgi:Ca2+-binding RTX toxin-like protein